ncbi:MAG: hypothetical protein ACI915_001867 [Gammaproteobacteria bacterium]
MSTTHFSALRNSAIAVLILAGLTTAWTPVSAEPPDEAPKGIVETLMAGEVDLQLLYRFENVDDDLVPRNDANASTLRAALGFRTGLWEVISAYAQMEHVSQVFVDDYKEGPGPVDAPKAGLFPVVADPPGTELNQAYVRYAGSPYYTVTAGRQIMTYRDAPFHRHLGTVLWRQNWQTQDGLSLQLKPMKDLDVNYAYSFQVNRIFGEDAPSPFNRFDCDCHYVNTQYRGLAHVKLEAFAYLLDIDNAKANSHNTYGGRASGAYPLNEQWKVLYAGEYATQSDSSDNPLSIDADYYLVEGGFNVKISNAFISSLTVKFDYEVLEGSGRPGTAAFNTPLTTGHAYQGWADRFLTTPIDGIEDTYITAVAGILGGQFIASYHMLDSDNLDYEYGDEFNIQYTHKVAKYFTLGAKAAVYSADRNATALARAGGLRNNDVTNFWAWVQFDY